MIKANYSPHLLVILLPSFSVRALNCISQCFINNHSVINFVSSQDAFYLLNPCLVSLSISTLNVLARQVLLQIIYLLPTAVGQVYLR